MAAYCRVDGLKAICGLTAYSLRSASDPMLGSEYGKTLPFTLLSMAMTILYFSKTVHWCILHSTQSNCYSAKVQTFFLSSSPIQSRASRHNNSKIYGAIWQH